MAPGSINGPTGGYEEIKDAEATVKFGSSSNGAVTKVVVVDEKAASGMDDRVSLMVIMFVVLIGDTARGIMFPTLWPYVKSMGGDKISQGWMVASFSLGRVVSSPWLGKWSTVSGYRIVLIFSSFVIAIGTLTYALAQNLQTLVAAQIIMGLGSGTLGVTRAYVADKSPHDQRTYWLAYLTAVQYAGFTCMPIVGAIISEVLEDSDYSTEFLGITVELNQFTAPGYVMCIAALICILLLATIFRDALPPRKKPEAPSQVSSRTEVAALISRPKEEQRKLEEQALLALQRTSSVDGAEVGGLVEVAEVNPSQDIVCLKFTRFDMAICGGFLLNVATKGTIACFETLGAEYSMVHFNMTSAEAGATFATFGACGVASLLSMRILCIWLNDVQLVLGGVIVMIVGCAMLVSSPTGAEGLPQFLIAVFSMYSIGYPIGHTAVLGLFSKVVGKRPQGTLLGWFGSAGSLARILFPIVAGVVSQELGSAHLFMLLVGVLLVAFAGLFAFRKTYMFYIEHGGNI